MSLSARLDALEQAITSRPTPCARCGADWPGSTVGSIATDGTRTFVCVRCGSDREAVAEPVKTYAAELLAGGLFE